MKTKTISKTSTKQAPKQSTKAQHKKPESLYYFDSTPLSHTMLRAYFLSWVVAQLGAIKAGAGFKLWPAANVSGHLATGKVIRKAGMYELSVSGVNAFTDEANPRTPDKETQAAFLESVKSGKPPKMFNHKMTAYKL
jgi:hypothetical protein